MKHLTGKVVSDKMQKTLVVSVDMKKAHPIYKKIIKRSTRLKVHYEGSDYKIGDTVRIIQVRPISKHKHYKVLREKR